MRLKEGVTITKRPEQVYTLDYCGRNRYICWKLCREESGITGSLSPSLWIGKGAAKWPQVLSWPDS